MASVLVVEDDVLIADLIGGWVSDAGHQVRGPVPAVHDALAVIADQGIDAALLDVRLGEEASGLDLARMLQAQRIPFAFLTGYSQRLMPSDLRDCTRLDKPFDREQVVSTVRKLLQATADQQREKGG